MSEVKGHLCDFCQCPIGYIQDGDNFNKGSDFLLKETKRICKYRFGFGTGEEYDGAGGVLELCQDCYDSLMQKTNELTEYIKSQKKDRPRIQVVKEVMEV